MLKPDGRTYIIEPPFHVSQKAFERMIERAQQAGFMLETRPQVFLSKTAVFKKASI